LPARLLLGNDDRLRVFEGAMRVTKVKISAVKLLAFTHYVLKLAFALLCNSCFVDLD